MSNSYLDGARTHTKVILISNFPDLTIAETLFSLDNGDIVTLVNGVITVVPKLNIVEELVVSLEERDALVNNINDFSNLAREFKFEYEILIKNEKIIEI